MDCLSFLLSLFIKKNNFCCRLVIMKNTTRYYLILFTTIAVYYVVSKYIFDQVYETIHIVIDEQFHIPQAEAYCNGNYSYWDPKITTLPGLYVISSAFLGTYFPCTTYYLRFVNLIASCVNLYLFGSILKYVYFLGTSQFKIVLQALSLTLLPPLYFFSHVYYTDTLSLTFLLAFSRLCFTNRYKTLIFLFGVYSVFMRQTNIAWVAMVFGHKLLDLLIKSSRVFGNVYVTDIKLSKNSSIAKDIDSSKLKRYYNLLDVYNALKYHLSTCFSTFFTFIGFQECAILFTHSLVLLSFVVFIFYNGSIVLGDKEAHTATLNLPQLLYFLVFYGIFGLPYVLAKLPSTLKLIFNNKLNALLLGMIFLIIVHFNTVIHPYLLADNRHFTFYIWNRWYGKYDYAIYATIPLYVFLYFSLYDNLRNQNCISFLLPYTLCVTIVLGLQKMLEVRYFLIPYIILRLRFARPSYIVVIFEFLWYLLINYAAFYVFFTKEVMWQDFDYVQRIIW